MVTRLIYSGPQAATIGIVGVGKVAGGVFDLTKWRTDMTIERGAHSITVRAPLGMQQDKEIAYLPAGTEGSDDEIKDIAIRQWALSNAYLTVEED